MTSFSATRYKIGMAAAASVITTVGLVAVPQQGMGAASTRVEVMAVQLDAVLAAAPRAQVCLLGIPPLDGFPLLPRPLADVLGWRGRVFDAIGRSAAAARPRMFRIEARETLGPEMFAEDGFHPSEVLHAAFADAVMAGLPELAVHQG